MKVNPLKYRVANRNPVIIKQTEDSLVESEERYRIAIEHSNDGVAIVKGCYHIFVNNKFLEIFGYNNRDEIIGNQIYITVHPDDREMVISINERRQRGEDVVSGNLKMYFIGRLENDVLEPFILFLKKL